MLKLLFSTGALLVGTRMKAAPSERSGKGALLLRCALRGHRYHDGPKALDRLDVGDALLVRREPENEFDAFAVSVHAQGAHLGYLPREHNHVVANLIDHGASISATLVQLHKADPYAPCVVEVRMANDRSRSEA